MYSDFKTISAYYDALYVNNWEYAPEAARVKDLLRYGKIKIKFIELSHE